MAVQLFFEHRGRPGPAGVAKMAAVAGFVVAAAFVAPTLPAPVRPWLWAAVVACGIGDACLALPGDRALLAGMAAFGVGHAGYAGAFVHLACKGRFDVIPATVAAGIVTVCGVIVVRRLAGRVADALVGATVAYAAIITVMVASAWGVATMHPWTAAGALAFAVSDVSVAEDRLVRPRFALRAWGLPLYFGAQLAIVWGLAPVRS